MQDINELINETDTDNVTLNKLKELASKFIANFKKYPENDMTSEVLKGAPKA